MTLHRLLVVLIVATWTVGEEQKIEDTHVVGIVDKNIRLPCDLPLSDPPSVEWVDLVYNTGRDPEPIFSTDSGGIATSHVNAANLNVSLVDFALTISRLKLEQDAGEYICRSRVGGQTHSRSYYLTVGGMPDCHGETQLREGSTTSLSCEAQYSGSLQPVLTWYRAGVAVDSTDDFEILMARRVLDLDKVTDDEDGVEYSCETTFGDLVESCSLTLDVLYLTRDVKFHPQKSVLRAGEELRCSARGNPRPHISMDPEPSEASRRQGDGWMSTVIEREWINRELTISCAAGNSVDGTTETVTESIRFNVTEALKGENEAANQGKLSSSNVSTAAIVLGIIIAGLVVVAAVIACVLVRRKKKKVPTATLR